jgi:hypothetical protein
VGLYQQHQLPTPPRARKRPVKQHRVGRLATLITQRLKIQCRRQQAQLMQSTLGGALTAGRPTGLQAVDRPSGVPDAGLVEAQGGQRGAPRRYVVGGGSGRRGAIGHGVGRVDRWHEEENQENGAITDNLSFIKKWLGLSFKYTFLFPFF